MQIVEITNRDNNIIEFKELSENEYSIKLFDRKNNEINYGWRLGLSTSKEEGGVWNMVDPPGGPYISLGYKIPTINKEVIEIINDSEGIKLKTK